MSNEKDRKKVILALLLNPQFSDLIYNNYSILLSVLKNEEKEEKIFSLLIKGFEKINPLSFSKKDACSELSIFMKDMKEKYPDKNFIKELCEIQEGVKNPKTTFSDALSSLYLASRRQTDEGEKTMADMWEYELDIYYKDNSAVKSVTNY